MFRTITPAGLGLVCSAFFVAACGPPEVTAPSFVNAPFGAASATFSMTLTPNGNTLDEVRVVPELAVLAMNVVPGSPDHYTRDFSPSACHRFVPYYYDVRYASNLPGAASGLLSEREPPAGSFLLRRSGTPPQDCRLVEGLDLVVDTTADLTDANPGDGVCAASNGACSLRAAIMETNARAGHDRISVPPGEYVLRLFGSESLDEPNDAIDDLDILDGLDLVGQSSSTVILDGDHQSRLLQVAAGSYDFVNVTGFTLRNGYESGEPGGAVHYASNTRIEGVKLLDNHLNPGTSTCAASVSLEVCNRGGAVFNKGRLLLRRVTIQDNSTCGSSGCDDSGQGGGISNFGPSARLFVETSTVANDSARFIGALHNWQGTVRVLNSTFADNRSSGWVSDVYNAGDGDVTIRHATFASSTDLPVLVNSTVGDFDAGTMHLESSVVHMDVEGASLCTGTLALNSTTFVGGFYEDWDYVGACKFGTGYKPNVVRFSVGALQNNGGTTDTIEILDGYDSGKIFDAGSTVCPNRDQAGVIRTGDADGPGKLGCDPGALEQSR